MNLVEICLALEDKSSGLGFEFDWTSENAMFKLKGIFHRGFNKSNLTRIYIKHKKKLLNIL